MFNPNSGWVRLGNQLNYLSVNLVPTAPTPCFIFALGWLHPNKYLTAISHPFTPFILFLQTHTQGKGRKEEGNGGRRERGK
jgi:hypothetical protein